MLNIKCICPPWAEVLQFFPFFARVAWGGLRTIWLWRRQQGMFRQGMPVAWLHNQDRQSRKLAFFIATAKSASENSIDVPRESFYKSKYPHPPKNPELLKSLNISLSWGELFLICLSTQNARICSPSLGRRLLCPVYFVCLPYQKSLKGLESLKPKSLKTCRSFLWRVLTRFTKSRQPATLK